MLEMKARQHADSLRKAWADNPADPTAVKSHAALMRAEARAFDQMGDLMLGLQGCWDHHGGAQVVRDGFKLMSQPWDKSRTYVLSAAEPKADEVAA
jgi:hypothetical protein